MTYRQRRRSTSIRNKAWREKRHEIWLRDKCRCQHCKMIVPYKQAQIDHIKPIAAGGTNHSGNLRTLCFLCHALRRDPSHIVVREKARKKCMLPEGWPGMLWGEVYDTLIKKYKKNNLG